MTDSLTQLISDVKYREGKFKDFGVPRSPVVFLNND